MKNPEMMKQANLREAFFEAKVAAESLGHEADFFSASSSLDFDEREMLREGAWVILCGGFRESVIRKIFVNLSLCFCDWESAQEIVDKRNIIRQTALDVFGNVKKVDAILRLADSIVNQGFESLKAQIIRNPIAALSSLHFIGPVTSYHLAKNLGFQVAKPDRHLNRISESNGFEDTHELCNAIARQTLEPISVVDGVLWRLSERQMTSQFKIFQLQKSEYPIIEYLTP